MDFPDQASNEMIELGSLAESIQKMKNKAKTRERHDVVYATVDVGEDRTLTVHYDPLTDQIEIEGAEPNSTRTERSYARESGKPKVVTSVPSDGKSAFSAKDALFAYEWVVAVDTNTKIIFGKKCGLCVSYFTPTPPSSCKGNIGVPFICLSAYLMIGIREGANPEQIGWHLTMTRNLRGPLPTSDRIALVVDSELGAHRDINARKVGYYRDHLLPPQVTIGYSSSDTDNETLGGQMIRLCDKMSTRWLEAMEKTRGFPAGLGPGGEDFEALYVVPVQRERVRSRLLPLGLQ